MEGDDLLRKNRPYWAPLVVIALVAGVVLLVSPRASDRAAGGALTVGLDPDAIAVDPNTHHVFVLNYADGTISMIDPRHGSTVRSLALSSSTSPTGFDITVSGANERVFVANGGDAVRVLDAVSGRLLRETHLSGRTPAFFARDDRTNRIFVTETSPANVGAGSTVSVLDARTGAWIRRSAAGVGPGPVAVDERTGHIFVQDLGASTVVMLDARSGVPLRTIALGGPSILTQVNVIGNPLPAFIGVDAATSRVFVGRYGAVTMLDSHTGTILKTVQVGRIPIAMDIDARTARVFVLNKKDVVSVLDARTGALLQTMRVGHSPWALTVAAAVNRVYVANAGDDTVSVMDGYGRVLHVVPGGLSPRAVAVDASLHQVYILDAQAYRFRPHPTGEWQRFIDSIPFIPHNDLNGSGSIPGGVTIISTSH